MISFAKTPLYAGGVLGYCIWDNIKCNGYLISTIQPAKVPFGAIPTANTQYAIANYNSNTICKFTFTGMFKYLIFFVKK